MRIPVFLMVLAVLLIAGCNGIIREEVRPVRTYSKSYFFHVVRYQGETLSLISRWYTGTEKNVVELRRQNRYIASSDDELPVNSKVLIPRRMLQTMKLMPIGFIRKNSPDLEYEEEATSTPVSTAIPSLTPTETATPTPANTSEPEPTVAPAPTPASRPTAPVISRPRAERRDFSDEDPSESPNTQIQIPQDIVDDLKNMGTAPKPPPERVQAEEPVDVFEPVPLFEKATPVPPPPPPPVEPQYNELPPEPEPVPEVEATISDDRRRLLEILQGKRNK